jgi:hypothetical protein
LKQRKELQSSDWWADLPQKVRQEVLKAVKEIEDGKGIPHDQVLAMYSSRLKRA